MGLNIKLLWDTPPIEPLGVVGCVAGIVAFAAWVRWGYKEKNSLAKQTEL
ncbi:hypothetical protein [Armatimonas sp.]